MPAHLDALADATARGFADAYGRDCEGVWSAPGRVNLIGEHTDYNEGFVLPFAIAARTSVAARRRNDGVLALASAQFPGKIRHIRLAKIRPGAVSGWPAYPAGRGPYSFAVSAVGIGESAGGGVGEGVQVSWHGRVSSGRGSRGGRGRRGGRGSAGRGGRSVGDGGQRGPDLLGRRLGGDVADEGAHPGL